MFPICHVGMSQGPARLRVISLRLGFKSICARCQVLASIAIPLDSKSWCFRSCVQDARLSYPLSCGNHTGRRHSLRRVQCDQPYCAPSGSLGRATYFPSTFSSVVALLKGRNALPFLHRFAPRIVKVSIGWCSLASSSNCHCRRCYVR